MKCDDIGGGFKRIRHLKDGAVVVESGNAEQQHKLRLALRERENVKLKNCDEQDPMLTITGIERAMKTMNL